MSTVVSNEKLPECRIRLVLSEKDTVAFFAQIKTDEIRDRIYTVPQYNQRGRVVAHELFINAWGSGWTKESLLAEAERVNQFMQDAGIHRPVGLAINDGDALESLLDRAVLSGGNQNENEQDFLKNITHILFNAENDEFAALELPNEEAIKAFIEKMKADKIKAAKRVGEAKIRQEKAAHEAKIRKEEDLEEGSVESIRGGIEETIADTNRLIEKLMKDNHLHLYKNSIDGSTDYNPKEVMQKSPELLNELKVLKDFRNKLTDHLKHLPKASTRNWDDKTEEIKNVIENVHRTIATTKKEVDDLPASTGFKRFDNMLIKLFNLLNKIGKALGITDLQLHKAESHKHMTRMEQDINSLSEPLTLYKELQAKKRAAGKQLADQAHRQNKPEQNDKNDKHRP